MSALAFSDDGRQLAAAYNDFSVRIFRLDGLSDGVLHKHEISLKGAHTGPISSVAFDAAGARLLSGSWDGTTRVWNLDTRKQQLIARNEKEQVTCVAFSPDGTWALIGYNGGGIRVRKIDSTTPLDAAIPAHTAAVTAATFSADGSRILTSSDDHTAKIWIVVASRSGRDDDTIVPKLVGSPIVLTHDASVSDAAFSADGSNIITASADGTARIWRSQQGEPRVLGVHDGRVESAMFSHDGTRVLTASDDRTARIWTIDGTSKPQVLAGHNEWVRSAAFDPADDRKVVTASEDGTLRLWDLAQRKSSVLQERSTVLGAAFDPGGTHVVTAVVDNTARIWSMNTLAQGGRPLDTPGQSEVIELPHDDWVLGAAFAGDGSKVVTASRDGTVRVWVPRAQLARPYETIPRSAGAARVQRRVQSGRITRAHRIGRRRRPSLGEGEWRGPRPSSRPGGHQGGLHVQG